MKFHKVSIALFLSLLTTSLFPQPSEVQLPREKKESLLDILVTQNLPKLSLEMDLKMLFDDRRMMNYQKAVAAFTFDNGKTWTDNIQLKTRGKYRSQKCDNPPLKLKYSKKALKGKTAK